jgi:hypothetical protein
LGRSWVSGPISYRPWSIRADALKPKGTGDEVRGRENFRDPRMIDEMIS